MENLSVEEKKEKILKLDKFERISGYSLCVYIDETGFWQDVYLGRWCKLVEPHIHTYPLDGDFYDKIRNETSSNISSEASSIEEVLEAVSDDIRDTILFNINLFR